MRNHIESKTIHCHSVLKSVIKTVHSVGIHYVKYMK
jgi:hypothetical protein